MGEKIKANLSVILNIVITIVILGGLAVGYGQTKGKILQVERDQWRLEKRQDRQDSSMGEIQKDVKKILISVGVIEGKLARNNRK